MRLYGIVRLHCGWLPGGHARLSIEPAGERLEECLARMLFGSKPGQSPEYESVSGLYRLEFQAFPLREGLALRDEVPAAWCQGCEAQRLHRCLGGPGERRRCLELTRVDRLGDDAPCGGRP